MVCVGRVELKECAGCLSSWDLKECYACGFWPESVKKLWLRWGGPKLKVPSKPFFENERTVLFMFCSEAQHSI